MNLLALYRVEPKKRSIWGVLLLTICSTAWILVRTIRLSGPDLVENYPYMFPDSFDWITNGLYYLDLWWNGATPASPTIRHPLFSFLVSFTYLMEYPTLLVILSQVAILGALFILYKTLQHLNVRPIFITLALVFLTFNYSFNLFRLFVMPDSLGIFFLTLSTYLYILAFNGESLIWHKLIWAAFVGALGSATQYFGVFSTLAFMPLLMLWGLRYKRKEWLVAAICAGTIAISPIGLWALFKKIHFGDFSATQVSHFFYLQLSFHNWDFYKTVWTVYFLPLIACVPFLILAFGVRAPSKRPSFETIFLLLLNALFFFFIFIYQWQEGRFTTFFFIQVTALFAVLCDRFLCDPQATTRPQVLLTSIALLVCAYVALTPTDDLMRPKFWPFIENLKSPELALQDNFIAVINRVRRVKRFKDNACIVKNETGMSVKEGCDLYITRNEIKYLEYRSRKANRDL